MNIKFEGEDYYIDMGNHSIIRTARLKGEIFCRTAITAALQFLADNYPTQLMKQKGSRVEVKKVDEKGRPYVIIRDYVSNLVFCLTVDKEKQMFHIITIGTMDEFFPRVGEYVITINQDKTITYRTWINVLKAKMTAKPVIERKVKSNPEE